MQLILTLGVPVPPHDATPVRRFRSGIIGLLDTDQRRITHHVEYVSPQACRCEEAGQIMTAGSLRGEWLYACMPTEVVRCRLSDMRIESVLTHPTFNDLHHVLALEDQMLICNTGIDLLQAFDYRGNVLWTHNAACTPTWERFSQEVDYRFVPSTKPHECHINHVFLYEDKIWLTRFHQKDAVCISEPDDTMPIEVGNPHDGLVKGDEIWFTTTNGHLVCVDGPRRRIARDIDLNAIEHPLGSTQLGWCRGVEIDGRYAYVGFTRFRDTTFKEFTRWIRNVGTRYPARIETIDLERRRVVETYELEPLASAVFMIRRAPQE